METVNNSGLVAEGAETVNPFLKEALTAI